jgi:hypothetical protein
VHNDHPRDLNFLAIVDKRWLYLWNEKFDLKFVVAINTSSAQVLLYSEWDHIFGLRLEIQGQIKVLNGPLAVVTNQGSL